MAIQCGEKSKKITGNEKKLIDLKNRVLKRDDPASRAVRASLGMHYREAGVSEDGLWGAFKAWVLDEVSVEIGEHPALNLPTASDIAHLTSLVDKSEREYKRMMSFGEKLLKKHNGNFDKAMQESAAGKARMIKHWHMMFPSTKRPHYDRIFMAGRVYHNNLRIKGKHEARTETAGREINGIMKDIYSLSEAKNKKEIAQLAKMDAEITKLETKANGLKELKTNNKLNEKGQQELLSTVNKLDEINKKRILNYSDYKNNPATVLSDKIIKIVEETDPDDKTKMITGISYELAIKKAHLNSLATRTQEFFNGMLDIGKETASNARELVDMHFERLGVPKEERKEAIDAIDSLNFEGMEAGYFTRMEVGAKDSLILSDIINKLEEASLVDSKSIAGQVTKLVAGYMERRTAQTAPRRRNRNLIDVAIKYTQQMLHANYTTSITANLERPAMVLRDLQKSTGSEEFMLAMTSWQHEIERLRVENIGSADHGALASLSRAVLATTTALKLGGLNPSGWLRNWGEGGYMAGAAVGIGTLLKTAQLRKESRINTKLVKHQKGQQVAFKVDKFWNPEKTGIQDRDELVDTFGEEIADANLGIRLSHNKHTNAIIKGIESGTNWIAQASMAVGWKQFENKPRRTAHNAGSVMGLMIAEKVYLPMFDDGIPIAHIKRFNLDEEKARDPDPEVWMEEYNKLEEELTNRGGFEIMGMSQFIYDAQERHFFESFKPGGAQIGKATLMFQHYPLSWNTAMYMALGRLYGRTKAGGIKAGIGATTKEKDWSTIPPIHGKQIAFNRDFTYLMSIAMAISANIWFEKEKAYGKKTGFRLYGWFSHTFIDQIQGVEQAIEDYGEPEKKAFYGKGIVGTVTGPPVQDFMDFVNIASIEAGMDNEEWPEWLAYAAQQVIGHAPNEETVGWDKTDMQSRIDSVVNRLRKVSPMISKGLPIFEHQMEREDPDQLTDDILRFLFNFSGGYYKREVPEGMVDPFEEEKLKRAERKENIAKELNASEPRSNQ